MRSSLIVDSVLEFSLLEAEAEEGLDDTMLVPGLGRTGLMSPRMSEAMRMGPGVGPDERDRRAMGEARRRLLPVTLFTRELGPDQ